MPRKRLHRYHLNIRDFLFLWETETIVPVTYERVSVYEIHVHKGSPTRLPVAFCVVPHTDGCFHVHEWTTGISVSRLKNIPNLTKIVPQVNMHSVAGVAEAILLPKPYLTVSAVMEAQKTWGVINWDYNGSFRKSTAASKPRKRKSRKRRKQ